MTSPSISQLSKKLKSIKGMKRLTISALIAFYVLIDADLPMPAKAMLSAALVYLVNPLDPLGVDPVVLIDDLAVLLGALATMQRHIRPHHKRQAKQRYNEL